VYSKKCAKKQAQKSWQKGSKKGSKKAARKVAKTFIPEPVLLLSSNRSKTVLVASSKTFFFALKKTHLSQTPLDMYRSIITKHFQNFLNPKQKLKDFLPFHPTPFSFDPELCIVGNRAIDERGQIKTLKSSTHVTPFPLSEDDFAQFFSLPRKK